MKFDRQKIERLVRESLNKKLAILREQEEEQAQGQEPEQQGDADDRAAQKAGAANVKPVERYIEDIMERAADPIKRLNSWAGDNRQKRLAIIRSLLTNPQLGALNPEQIDGFLERMFKEIE